MHLNYISLYKDYRNVMKGNTNDRKIIAIILIILFVFAFIRITTSIYENKKRANNLNTFKLYNEENPAPEFTIGYLYV